MTPDALASLYADAFPDSRPWTAQEFAELIESPKVFLIAEAQGFALGRQLGPECELLTIAVTPTMQGQGTGRLILKQFERHATSLGCAEIFLEVSALNRPAINLYFSAGYKEIARRKAYYKHKDGSFSDALILRKQAN